MAKQKAKKKASQEKKFQEMIDKIQDILGFRNCLLLTGILYDSLYNYVRTLTKPDEIHTIEISFNGVTTTFDCVTEEYITNKAEA